MNITYDSTTGGNEGKGRRTGMSDSSGSSTTWKYNVLGHVIDETPTIPSNASTETLTYNYNPMGALLNRSGTNTYISQINYAPSGQVEDQLLGNSLRQQSCYDSNTLRVTKIRVYTGIVVICANTPSSPRLDPRYTYQISGNIGQIVDATQGETLNYTYDDLGQLDTVSGPYSHDYNYNTIGNLTSKNSITYTYGDTAHKHAVTSLSGGGGTNSYDADGHMTQCVEGRQTYTRTFDAENRLISVAVGGPTTQFIYDGDGNPSIRLRHSGQAWVESMKWTKPRVAV